MSSRTGAALSVVRTPAWLWSATNALSTRTRTASPSVVLDDDDDDDDDDEEEEEEEEEEAMRPSGSSASVIVRRFTGCCRIRQPRRRLQ